MSSTEPRPAEPGANRVAPRPKRVDFSTSLALLVVVFSLIASISFSSRAETQHETPRESLTLTSSTVEVALLVAALGVYGWAANKLYDVGKEVGRARALRGDVGRGQVWLGESPERLLD